MQTNPGPRFPSFTNGSMKNLGHEPWHAQLFVRFWKNALGFDFFFFLSVNLQDETRDTCSPLFHPYDSVEYD